MPNEFYEPIQHALANLNNQVNVNYQHRRQAEMDLNNAAMQRLDTEMKLSDPVRQMRIQKARQQIAPRDLELPTFKGDEKYVKNANVKMLDVVRTMVPELPEGSHIKDGRLMDGDSNTIPLPHWMASRAEEAGRGTAIMLKDPRIKREQRINELNTLIKKNKAINNRGVKVDGELKALEAELKAKKNFDPTGQRRLAELQQQNLLIDEAAMRTQDTTMKEWYRKFKNDNWDEAKLLNPKLKGAAPGTDMHMYYAVDGTTGQPYKNLRAKYNTTKGANPLSVMPQISTSGVKLPPGTYWQLGGNTAPGSGTKGGTPTKEHTAKASLNTMYSSIDYSRKQKHGMQLWLDGKVNVMKLLERGDIDESTKNIIESGRPEVIKRMNELDREIIRLEAGVNPANINDPVTRRVAVQMRKALDPEGIDSGIKKYSNKDVRDLLLK
jgi:hypothetical protein